LFTGRRVGSKCYPQRVQELDSRHQTTKSSHNFSGRHRGEVWYVVEDSCENVVVAELKKRTMQWSVLTAVITGCEEQWTLTGKCRC
jgi:hypothetical protein